MSTNAQYDVYEIDLPALQRSGLVVAVGSVDMTGVHFGVDVSHVLEPASEHEVSKTETYAWAATYSAGSDAFVYRRYKGKLPEYAKPFAKDAPPHVVAFCDAHGLDVAVEDELVAGRVRRVRRDMWSDETP